VSVKLTLTVNGKAVTAEVDPRTLLVEFLRTNLALTGTHVGCDTGQCGACTIHLDGRAVKACNMLAAQANGAAVVTIEGLAAAPSTSWSGIRRPTSRRSVKDWKATSAAAPGTTTSSARCRLAPPRWANRG